MTISKSSDVVLVLWYCAVFYELKPTYCCIHFFTVIFFEVSSVSFSVLLEISRILNTGLDMETLSICVRLCEQGINPEALSSVIKELRKATEALKVRVCVLVHSKERFFCLEGG